MKRGYIGGPLTDLRQNGPLHWIENIIRWCRGEVSVPHRAWAYAYYEALGELCEEILGVRSFVPHLEFPVCDPGQDPVEVYEGEREMIEDNTGVLVVTPFIASTGMGMEIPIAMAARVPVVILVPKGTRVTEFLLGAPVKIIYWRTEDEAFRLLASWLRTNVMSKAS